MKKNLFYILGILLLISGELKASDSVVVGKKFIFRDTICNIDLDKAEKNVNLPYSSINPGYELKVLLRQAGLDIKNKAPFSDIICVLFYSANQFKNNYILRSSLSTKVGDLHVKEDFFNLKETLKLNPIYQKKYSEMMSDKDFAKAMEIKNEEE